MTIPNTNTKRRVLSARFKAGSSVFEETLKQGYEEGKALKMGMDKAFEDEASLYTVMLSLDVRRVISTVIALAVFISFGLLIVYHDMYFLNYETKEDFLLGALILPSYFASLGYLLSVGVSVFHYTKRPTRRQSAIIMGVCGFEHSLFHHDGGNVYSAHQRIFR